MTRTDAADAAFALLALAVMPLVTGASLLLLVTVVPCALAVGIVGRVVHGAARNVRRCQAAASKYCRLCPRTRSTQSDATAMSEQAKPETKTEAKPISFTAAELHTLVRHVKEDAAAIAQKFNDDAIVQKIEHAVSVIDTPQGMAVLAVVANLAITAIGEPEQLKSLTFIAGVGEKMIAAMAHPAPLPA